jgi:transposase-like protein
MAHRWTKDRPVSLQAFLRAFPDDDACAAYLYQKRWPDGFVCPGCGSLNGYKLPKKKWTWRCRDCSRQTSVTSGTIMHASHLPLRTWFLAAHLVATHSNGISAQQLQVKAGIGSYKSAWFLLHRLRKAMVDPDRSKLAGIVEIDETSFVYRTKDDPVWGGQGRSPIGKMVVAGAIELAAGKYPARIRLGVIPNFTRETLHGFVEKTTEKGSTIWTDGNTSYADVPDRKHVPKVIRKMAAHILMPWIHRVFSNLKRFAMGVYHGFRRKYLQAYLDEFVFRWNRRRYYRVSFDHLLGIGFGTGHLSYRTLTAK